ncbi:MAG: dockerin type I domain-containing protein [Firmicutes bacterium]|nr:dockerin type I domain-containing protein [Bacillota bacterium]
MSLIKRIISTACATAVLAACAFFSVSSDSVVNYSRTYSANTILAGTAASQSYQSADDKVRTAVDLIKSAIESQSARADLSSVSGITLSDTTAAMNIVQQFYGEYFYVDWMSCLYTATSVSLDYYYTGSELAALIARFNSGISALTRGITDETSDYEKALIIHDNLALSAAQNIDPDAKTFDNYYELKKFENYTAFGVVCNGTGFADSYSYAYMTALRSVGVNCERVISNSMNTSWNIVQIDGEWYHVDVTMDDPSTDLYGRVRHDYFLMSDSYLSNPPRTDVGKHTGGVTNYSATSTKYDLSPVKYAVSRVSSDGNYSYYLVSGGKITKYNAATDSAATIYTISDRWYVYNGTQFTSSFYSGVYSGLELIGGRLYFNTSKSVNSVGTDGSGALIVNTVDASKSLIYGICYDGTDMYCSMQTNPDADTRVINKVPLQTKVYVSLSISSEPDCTDYLVGDTVNMDGLVVMANYNDGSSTEILPIGPSSNYGYSVSGANTSAAGEVTVTVTFSGKSASFKINVYNYGDINFDGTVGADDVSAVEQHILGVSPLSGMGLKSADINGDGIVNGTDLVMIKRAAL